jgi:hypothetical protein
MMNTILKSVVLVAAVCAVPLAGVAAAGPLRAPEVKITRTPGRVLLEVADDFVTVRKDIRADASVATITTKRDELTMAVKRGVLTVSSPGGSMVLGKDGAAAHDRLLVVLQGSEAAVRGRALLARVEEGPETFAGQSLLLTRALLEFGTGSKGALTQHKKWVAERATRATIVPASIGRTLISWQKMGPGDCWDMYSKEAIRIAEDFEQCTEGLRWYEAHLWAGCSVIYAVRAEGAMAWFIACNGGVPFNG